MQAGIIWFWMPRGRNPNPDATQNIQGTAPALAQNGSFARTISYRGIPAVSSPCKETRPAGASPKEKITAVDEKAKIGKKDLQRSKSLSKKSMEKSFSFDEVNRNGIVCSCLKH